MVDIIPVFLTFKFENTLEIDNIALSKTFFDLKNFLKIFFYFRSLIEEETLLTESEIEGDNRL